MMSIEAFAHSGQVDDVARVLKDILKPAELAKLVTLLEGAETKRQSGMEDKHEKWVLETLNFLHSMEIPVWNHNAKGVRLPHDKEIPERLNLLREKIMRGAKKEIDAIREASDLRTANRRLEQQVAACHSLLGRFGKEIIETFPELRDAIAPTPPAAPPQPEVRPLDRRDS
jgi:hypothetical protein